MLGNIFNFDIKRSADQISSALRNWLADLFVTSINTISRPEDQEDVIEWLRQSRDVIDSDKVPSEKFGELYALTDMKKTAQIVANSVAEAVRNYQDSDLPLAVKVSVPLTLLAAPFIGGQGAGIAAFGGAIGLPVIVLIFLGSAGITSIIEAFTSKDVRIRSHIEVVMDLIARDQALRHIRAAMKSGNQGPPGKPSRADLPEDERQMRDQLLAMDPYLFESHVMSFFWTLDPNASTTKKSGDKGIDGFARHPEGLVVVQCKRYSPDNPVGSDKVQQFKGAIEESEAWRGYLITTSHFTSHARQSAQLSSKLALVDMEELVRWHRSPPRF